MNENQKLILLQDLGYIYPNKNSKQKRRYGLYKCFCGKEFETQIQYVKIKDTKSCGCLKIKHNLTSHRIFGIWRQMVDRCTNQNNRAYKNYGGRGIKVCDRWLKVENFINDMYPAYQEGLSIDRIDVNGNYEPNNCRWTTKNTQARNTRKIISTNTSGYRGVGWEKKCNKWRARISVDNKQIHLGLFLSAIEAAKAYDKYIIDNKLEHTKNFS